MAACLHELLERIAPVDRDDRSPRPVVGGMEGDGQLELDLLFGKLIDLRDQSAGGQRDLAGADSDSPVGVDDPDGPKRRAVIRQRFPHAHDDDVVDGSGITGQHDLLIDLHDLVDDFSRRHVTHEALEPTRAEPAADGASHLGGDAERIAPRAADQHRLHLLAVLEFEQVLRGRTVTGLRPPDEGQGVQTGTAGQFGPQRLGQVGHLVERTRGLLVHPRGDLPGPVRRFVHLGDDPGDLGQGKASQFGLPANGLPAFRLPIAPVLDFFPCNLRSHVAAPVFTCKPDQDTAIGTHCLLNSLAGPPGKNETPRNLGGPGRSRRRLKSVWRISARQSLPRARSHT